ncbi:MAG: phage tail tube protein [Eubacteriales bacterium]|jgi:hypothetical protein
MANYVRLRDTISSKEGRAYITINGKNRELFEISRLKASLQYKIQKRQMLGHRMVQHKVVGAEGTGEMTMYFMNSEMLQLARQYIKEGNPGSLKLQVVNEDSASSVGRQEVMLLNVMLEQVPITCLDDSSDDPVTISCSFTFDDIEVLESFALPENYR